MNLVCLDLEGVLVPEMWLEFAAAANIPELNITTREEPDYDKLMKYRLSVLAEKGYGLKEIQDVIETLDPLPGAKEFLDEIRSMAQVVIISDTFEQFAMPLMKKLGYPTLFCNSLVVDEDGKIVDYQMRCEDSKLTTIRGFHSCGMETIASGDSHNDLKMIRNSKAGWLFRSTPEFRAANADLTCFDEYDDLLAAIKAAL